MTPEDYLNAGNLRESLQLLQERVRKDPSNAKDRIFLFQLLVIMGQWERALTQLKVVKELDERSIPMSLTYQQLIVCEQYREQVFAGKCDPIVFGKPEDWMAMLIHALRLSAEEKYEASHELRHNAFEKVPTCCGLIDDQAFEWLADSDPRIGPVFEAYIDGRYFWIAQESVQLIMIEEPADLRDFVWQPAHFTWSNGGESYGFLPTRYPFSYQVDDQLALSRKTIWEANDKEMSIGYGQKMLTTDRSDFAVMDVRKIVFNRDLIQEKV